ncbi:MAG: gliding motility-associated C-terminal domain-containing protein [Bacteroidales bacterium]|nr:gliding motility-associated C-terminal domain-containing protein [Bacteroidales bacterium]
MRQGRIHITGNIWRFICVGLLFAFHFSFFASPLQAQPQLRNATSFDTGDSLYYWSARIGARLFRDNVTSDTTTGYHVMSSCIDMHDLVGDSLIKSLCYKASDTNYTFTDSVFMSSRDALSFRFTIYDSSSAGLDRFTTDSLGHGMQRIAPGYETSIRLGCMYNTAFGVVVDPQGNYITYDSLQAVIDTFIVTRTLPPGLIRGLNEMFRDLGWQIDTTRAFDTLNVLQRRLSRLTAGSQSLFYTMRVNEDNALLFINFALVARSYNHDTWQAGEFLVRVVSRDSSGEWKNEPINDSLWYRVSAPRDVGNLDPTGPWRMGAGSGDTLDWPSCYVYKPWSKCAVNLIDFIGQDVRVEFYSSNCIYGVDPFYVYFAGDYMPPALASSGCTGGTSPFIDTLIAPPGLLGYEWFVSQIGPQDDLFDTENLDTIPWRRLTNYQSSNVYCPTVTDFVLSSFDTLFCQTFKCIMYSALDPAKPIASTLYVNVFNHKPMPQFTWTDSCDLGITFTGTSTAPIGDEIDTAATYYIIYNDLYGNEPLDTLYGNTVRYVFPEARPFLIEQHVFVIPYDSVGTTCGGGKRTVVTPRGPTPIPIRLSAHSLCYGRSLAVSTLIDSTARAEMADGTLHLEWTVNGQPLSSLNPDYVTNTGDTMLVLTALPEGSHEVALTTTNRCGCVYTSRDTVYIYQQPRILTDPANGVLCLGDTLRLEAFRDDRQLDSAWFEWSAEPPDSDLDAQQGSPIVYLSPEVNSVYTLHTSPLSLCQVEDISVAITVSEYPVPQLSVTPNPLDMDHPVVNLNDLTEGAMYSTWYLSDGTVLSGLHLSHSFLSVPTEGVTITLHTCNYADCCADTSVTIGLAAATLWIPNIFFPGGADNNRFFLSSNQQLLEFEIYIYDRRGQLVYTTTDPQFEWDGTDLHGQPLPQGAYVYVFSYRLASSDTYRYPVKGTVTLLR